MGPIKGRLYKAHLSTPSTACLCPQVGFTDMGCATDPSSCHDSQGQATSGPLSGPLSLNHVPTTHLRATTVSFAFVKTPNKGHHTDWPPSVRREQDSRAHSSLAGPMDTPHSVSPCPC